MLPDAQIRVRGRIGPPPISEYGDNSTSALIAQYSLSNRCISGQRATCECIKLDMTDEEVATLDVFLRVICNDRSPSIIVKYTT